MTVPTQTNKAIFTANGVTTEFPFTFGTLPTADLVVTLIDGDTETVVNPSDYTVRGAGRDDGGSVVFNDPPASGLTVLIQRLVPYTQPTDYKNQGSFYPRTHERSFDRATMQVQQLAEEVSRSLRIRPGYTLPVSLYLPTPEASLLIGWNADGSALRNTDPSGPGDLLLRSDLADPTGGGGLVAFDAGRSVNEALAYSLDMGETNFNRNRSQPQAQVFWARVRSGAEDVHVFIGSDSTGNETWEWPYQVALWIAGRAPTHTVRFRFWNDGAQAWDAYTVLATGSGARTINIDCCAVAGVATQYLQGGREALIFSGSSEYSLAILNYGHNTGTDTREWDSWGELVASASHMLSMAPGAGVLVTLQNPRRDVPEHTAALVSSWSRIAGFLGLGVIDVYSAFMALPDLAPYYSDTVHPNALGMEVWTDVAKAALSEMSPAVRASHASVNPLEVTKANYANNPMFAAWPDDDGVPTGWAFNNCTASKNPGRGNGGLYAVEVTPTGSNPNARCDLGAALPRIRGKTITVALRLWRPSNMNSTTGRISIIASSGGASVSRVSSPRLAYDGWVYAIVSLAIPRDSTALRVEVFTGAANGSDNGKKMWLYSLWVGEGVLPGAVDTSLESQKTISDYYSPDNVGLRAGATGTLTVSGNDISVSGADPNGGNVYINMIGLTPGEDYTVTWEWVTDSIDNGNPHGGVYVRNGLNGGSSTISDTPFATGTVTFTAPAGSCSLWVYGNAGVTSWTVNNWSIVKAS